MKPGFLPRNPRTSRGWKTVQKDRFEDPSLCGRRGECLKVNNGCEGRAFDGRSGQLSEVTAQVKWNDRFRQLARDGRHCGKNWQNQGAKEEVKRFRK
jgi:hypothetical protein